MTTEPSFTVAGSAISGLVRYAGARGVRDAGAIAEDHGLSLSTLDRADARAPQQAYNALFEALAARAADPDFGLHFAEALDLDAFDVVGHLAAKSATLGEALDRVARYSRIVHDGGRFEIDSNGARALVFPGCRGLIHQVPRQVAEFSAASVITLARVATGAPIVPVAVELRHPRPSRITEHRRVLQVEPSFGAAENVIVLDRAALDLKIVSQERAVAAYLDAYARDALTRLPPEEEDLASKVQRLVVTELARGDTSATRIGKLLGMHPRTMQRRLAELDTSLAALVDEARASLARRYLADDRLAVGEIAFLLGFSDPSNFHRAFRRWTGVTPAAFREAAQR